MGKNWKWQHSLPEWRFDKLKIDTPKLANQNRESLLSEFKAYHGCKYKALIYKDENFGQYITKIKVLRAEGLRTSNRKIMKYHLKNKWKRYIPQKHNSDLAGQVESIDTVERLVET